MNVLAVYIVNVVTIGCIQRECVGCVHCKCGDYTTWSVPFKNHAKTSAKM